MQLCVVLLNEKQKSIRRMYIIVRSEKTKMPAWKLGFNFQLSGWNIQILWVEYIQILWLYWLHFVGAFSQIVIICCRALSISRCQPLIEIYHHDDDHRHHGDDNDDDDEEIEREQGSYADCKKH